MANRSKCRPAERILLDLLREDLNLTGTKRGCDLGNLRVLHRPARRPAALSCLTLAAMAEGRSITTYRGGLFRDGTDPQKAFVTHGATGRGSVRLTLSPARSPCCGIIPMPPARRSSNRDLREICAVYGYTKIVEAILAARPGGARSMAATPKPDLRLLGGSIPYIEGPLKVSCSSQYTDDLKRPGTLVWGNSFAPRGPTPVSSRST